MKLVALALATATVLIGCTKAAPVPSTTFKLVCKADGQQLVVLMNTLTHTATLANLPGAPRGTFTETDYEYHLAFPQSGRVSASEALVNRYDGVMIRELGKPPFKLDGITTAKDNLVYYWKCERAEGKPLL